MAVLRPFKLFRKDGETLVMEETKVFCIYREETEFAVQTGIVGCASIDDYGNCIIKKHENTKAEKVEDRTREYDLTGESTEPIFLAYHKRDDVLTKLMAEYIECHEKDYEKEGSGIKHTYWIVRDKELIGNIKSYFQELDTFYIADGHHRCMSAYNVGMLRRDRNPDYTGEEEFNYVLSAVFPHDELKIMEYNRIVKDMNGHTEEEIVKAIEQQGFDVKYCGTSMIKPTKKHEIVMYISENWYMITWKGQLEDGDAVKSLDATILQDLILDPIFDIKDPRRDLRLDFVGGIDCDDCLIQRMEKMDYVGFILYPVSIEEVFAVADSNQVMPPKSTWFEPKLGSGLFIHRLEC